MLLLWGMQGAEAGPSAPALSCVGCAGAGPGGAERASNGGAVCGRKLFSRAAQQLEGGRGQPWGSVGTTPLPPAVFGQKMFCL